MDADLRLRLEGRWDRIRGRIKELWGEITDDDLEQAEGSLERLVGRIKEKTGESLAGIEEKLRSLDQEDS
jgi:uncharacterized protein YjbJ (UPF0337 family)